MHVITIDLEINAILTYDQVIVRIAKFGDYRWQFLKPMCQLQTQFYLVRRPHIHIFYIPEFSFNVDISYI